LSAGHIYEEQKIMAVQAGNIVCRDGMRGVDFQVAVTKGIVVISTTFGQAIKPTASGQVPFGVVEKDWDQYVRGEVITKGKCAVRISEAITYGAFVSIGNTSGYVKTAHPGEPLVGRAVMAGTTAGDEIEVELMLGAACPSTLASVNAATYTVPAGVDMVEVLYSATGTSTITLPTARLVAGQRIYVHDKGGNANNFNITIDTEGAETINGAASIAISAAYGGKTIVSDGTNWYAW
jgi:hypothetical protein